MGPISIENLLILSRAANCHYGFYVVPGDCLDPSKDCGSKIVPLSRKCQRLRRQLRLFPCTSSAEDSAPAKVAKLSSLELLNWESMTATMLSFRSAKVKVSRCNG